nr:Rieske (2Fe-2S) protein [Enterovibrio nigricans]
MDFCGHDLRTSQKGSFITVDIGRNSVIVVRDNKNELRAFHNTCRHRGSKICLTSRGKMPKLVCPYHQWAYDLDGSLVFAGSDMGDDFDKSGFSLSTVHCRAAGGYIFICLADTPPPIDDFLNDLAFYLELTISTMPKLPFEAK